MSTAALIVGGHGGLGSALRDELVRRQPGMQIFVTAREPGDAETLRLDLREPDSITQAMATLARQLEDQALTLHQVLICSGVLSPSGTLPERRVDALQFEDWTQVLQVNALGPLLVARAVLPLLPRREPSRLMAVSARVGSISDNHKGGWYSYRMSKAALNMGFRSLALELRRTHPGCTPTLYHPGTVATALSAPFQAGVPADKLFSPTQAAEYCLDVLQQRDGAQELAFVDWAGQPIAW